MRGGRNLRGRAGVSASGVRRERAWALIALAVTMAAATGTEVRAGCNDPPGPDVEWRRCYLDGRDLRGADLTGAMLHDATFQRADLSNADLSGARASRATFMSAHLTGAKINGAVLRSEERRVGKECGRT